MSVKKRNGRIEAFNIEKIVTAARKAYEAGDAELPEEVEKQLRSLFSVDRDEIDVEEIQDEVEKILMKDNPEFAKAFIIYRYKHQEARYLEDRIKYMNNYINSTESAASASETDANANVTIKNVANLEGEVYKTTNRIIQRKKMKTKLKEMFSEVADNYEKDLNHHIIYVHDEASSPVLKNYCEAVSLYPLLTDGVGTIDGITPSSPNSLDAFCGQVVNLAFLLSAQCKGAVAFGGLFVAFNLYCIKEWGEEYYLKEDVIVTSDHCKKQRTIKDRIEQAFQAIVYGWNQPAGNRSYQSPFTNVSYYDSNYYKALFEDFYYPDGTQPKWEAIDYLQKLFMKWFNKERTKTILTFPVETMALLSDDKDIIDKEYKNFTAEMYAEGHSFFTYISSNPNGLSSCCRLRSEIEENVFSFTNGLSGIQTGSCNVITLNLNRIIQDFVNETDILDESEQEVASNKKRDYAILTWRNNPDYRNALKKYLISILERVYKYHIAYKTMLYELEEKGMFTSSNAGYIHMNKLYSTIGINGLNEAALFLDIPITYNEDYKQFVQLITGTISEQNKLYSTKRFKFNQEFVPAEGLSSKNFNWDAEDGYWTPDDGRVLYNSYIYDAHDDTSVLDKFRLHGKDFTGKMDGGVGCHVNLEEHLTKEQYLKLIDYAIKVGNSYFTFNIPNTQCDDCKSIYKYPLVKCPKCGSINMTQYTRVIGFMKAVKNFDHYRYIEANQRTYSKNVEI